MLLQSRRLRVGGLSKDSSHLGRAYKRGGRERGVRGREGCTGQAGKTFAHGGCGILINGSKSFDTSYFGKKSFVDLNKHTHTVRTHTHTQTVARYLKFFLFFFSVRYSINFQFWLIVSGIRSSVVGVGLGVGVGALWCMFMCPQYCVCVCVCGGCLCECACVCAF